MNGRFDDRDPFREDRAFPGGGRNPRDERRAPDDHDIPSAVLRNALDLVRDAVFILDARGLRICDANRTACSRLGYTLHELRQMDYFRLAPNLADSAVAREVRRVIGGTLTQATAIRVRHRRQDGESLPAEISLQRFEGRGKSWIIVTARDVPASSSPLRDNSAALARDPLTGMHSRGYFECELEAAFARARRHAERFAVMFIDVDHFKLVNDTYGHLAGDEVLRTVTARIASAVRHADVIARYGGDEFVVLLQDIGAEREVTQIARRMCRELKAPIHLKHESILVTASVGIALSSAAYNDAPEMLNEADRAMYRAKARGRAGRYRLARAPRRRTADLREQPPGDRTSPVREVPPELSALLRLRLQGNPRPPESHHGPGDPPRPRKPR